MNQPIFDSAALSNGSGTSLTFQITIGSHNERKVYVGFCANGQGSNGGVDETVSVTVGGKAGSKVNSQHRTGNDERYSLWVVDDPPTGTQDVVITLSNSRTILGAASSYYDCKQGASDGSAFDDLTGISSLTVSVTTTADNCLLVGFVRSGASNFAAGTNTTLRTTAATWGMVDSNAAQTPPGSHSLNVTTTASQEIAMNMASFAPGSGLTSGIPQQAKHIHVL